MQKQTRKVEAVKYISMIVVALAFFFVQFHRNTPGVMRDELMEQFAMNATAFGLFSSLYSYPYMIAQIPVGMLLDSIGARRTIALCSAIAAAGACIFGMSGTYVSACFGRILIGVGVAAPVISTQKFLLSWVGPDKSASYYGVFSFIGKLGGMIAQLPLAWLVSQFDWRTVFFLCGTVSIVIAALCILTVKDSPEEIFERRKVTKVKTTFPELLSAMGCVIKNRYVWAILAVMFLHQGLYGMFSSTWAVPYLEDVFGLTTIQASAYTTCMLVGAMFFAVSAGIVSDRMHSRKIVIGFVSVILIVVYVTLAFCGDFLMRTHLMWGIMFLMGAGGCSVQIMFAYSREMNDPKFVGISVSVINMIGMLGTAVFPTIFGSLLDKSAVRFSGAALYRAAFIPCIVLSITALGLTILAKETGCKNRFYELKNNK